VNNVNKRGYGFGPTNFNNNLNAGYGALKSRSFEKNTNPYETPEQQSLRWARKERADYDEAYPEEESFLRTQRAVQEFEPAPLGNTELPINSKRSEIEYAITHDRVTLLVSDTGSGKSTQVPQIALDAGFDYVVQTQPLRLAARTIADRISDEILSVRPYESPDISAYHTGEQNTSTSRTKILQATEGILYVQDIHNRLRDDNELRIHDEIHKGGLIGDMAIALSVLRMRQHPEMKMVLQSATVDIEKWTKYIHDVLGVEPTVIRAEGRTFPVEILENPNVTPPEQAALCIEEAYKLQQEQKKLKDEGYEGELRNTSGAVVCPGLGEIKEWTKAIEEALPPEIAMKTYIVPLHSQQTAKEQQQALRTDYDGIKVVMTTDTARSSVTIEDLGWLVDCGYARRIEIDDEGVESLVLYKTSHADRMQWLGRIGRTGPGTGYQVRMNKNLPFTPLDEAHKFDQPEIKRSNIEQFILGIKAIGIDFEDLPLPEHADRGVIERCRENCRIIGALDENYELTAIGRRMVDCSTGYISARMLVEADNYSPEIQAYVAAMAASHEAGGLQQFSQRNSKRWKGETGLTTETLSDLFAQLDIFIATQDMKPYEWRQYDLNEKHIMLARETYQKMIRKSQAVDGPLELPSDHQREEILNCIYASMIDNVFVYDGMANKKRTYKGIRRFQETPRTISSRSVVTGKYPFLLGIPRGVESIKKDQLKYKDIIQNVTGVDDLRTIGRFAAKVSSWELADETRWRNGRPIVTRKQVFHGYETGNTEELVATPSSETRKALIQHALENPGPAQQKIRSIKKQLEELNHIAKDGVPQLLQSDLIGLIQKAAPEDVLDPYIIDFNLQAMNITLETFGLTAERLQQIKDNSPESISTGTGVLKVTYRNTRPIVHKYDLRTVLGFPDFKLRDGREVYFVHQQREYTLSQLREVTKDQ
jgi:HrpA-like RNA helicase